MPTPRNTYESLYLAKTRECDELEEELHRLKNALEYIVEIGDSILHTREDMVKCAKVYLGVLD